VIDAFGWDKVAVLHDRPVPAVQCDRQLMMAILHERVHIVDAVSAQPTTLEDAPCGLRRVRSRRGDQVRPQPQRLRRLTDSLYARRGSPMPTNQLSPGARPMTPRDYCRRRRKTTGLRRGAPCRLAPRVHGSRDGPVKVPQTAQLGCPVGGMTHVGTGEGGAMGRYVTV
jgi:hypothetical protein